MSDSTNVDFLDLMQDVVDSATIAVVYSGDPEQENTVLRRTFNYRAWASYSDVSDDIALALRRLGYQRVSLHAEGTNLLNQMRDTSTDFAWLNTGGTQGYDSMAHAAALMESMGIPYVGHRPLTYLITDSKPDAKDKMQSWGIPTPKSSFFGSRGKPDAHALQHLRPPFVVKPQNGSMSRNVRYAEDVKEALAAILEVRSSCGLGVLVEEFIGGTEITVAALGTFHKQDGVWSEHDDPLVLPILRRIGNHGKIFPSIQSINVRESTELYRGQYGDDVYRIAQLVYHAFRCRTAVRIDMILDETGTPYVIDINPKPDLKAPSETGDSFVNVAASAIGLDYDNLIKTILYDRLYHVLLDESPRWKEPLPWRVLKSLSS